MVTRGLRTKFWEPTDSRGIFLKFAPRRVSISIICVNFKNGCQFQEQVLISRALHKSAQKMYQGGLNFKKRWTFQEKVAISRICVDFKKSSVFLKSAPKIQLKPLFPIFHCKFNENVSFPPAFPFVFLFQFPRQTYYNSKNIRDEIL